MSAKDSNIEPFLNSASPYKESEDINTKRNIPISFFKIVNLDDDRHIKITATATPEEIA